MTTETQQRAVEIARAFLASLDADSPDMDLSGESNAVQLLFESTGEYLLTISYGAPTEADVCAEIIRLFGKTNNEAQS